jgi:hypothetical protein
MLFIMTTGLQKVIPLERAVRRPAVQLRDERRTRGRFHRFVARLRLVPRQIATAHAPTARDVHDAAVMRGVFPPRV